MRNRVPRELEDRVLELAGLAPVAPPPDGATEKGGARLMESLKNAGKIREIDVIGGRLTSGGPNECCEHSLALTIPQPLGKRDHVMAAHQSTVEYRDIPDWPGYRVGNDGSVWSCWRRLGAGVGGGTRMALSPEWKRLKPRALPWGHLKITLSVRGRRQQFYVHRLVLELFVGPCPVDMEARHFPDRDPSNNAVSNLSWATKKVNQGDRVVHGTDSGGEKCGAAKLTWEMVRRIRAEYVRGSGVHGTWQLAAKYGVSQTSIRLVLSGRTWREAG